VKRCPACAKRFNSVDWQCPACGNEPTKIDGFLAFAPGLAYEGKGFRPEYFEELARLETGNFWFETFVNWIFGIVMKLERIMIRLGVRFPFGGSLLLVARKG